MLPSHLIVRLTSSFTLPLTKFMFSSFHSPQNGHPSTSSNLNFSSTIFVVLFPQKMA